MSSFMDDAKGTHDKLVMQQVLDTLDEVFFVFTAEGQLLQWNQRIREITGYTDEEISEMDPADFAPADDRWLITRKLMAVLEHGRARLTTQLITKDGCKIPYEFTGSLLEWEDQQLICGTGRDVTERKQAEEALRQSEEKFRALAEESLVGICVIQDATFDFVNDTFAQMFGYEPEEMTRRLGPKDIVHPFDWSLVKENLRRRIEGDVNALGYEFRGITREKETIDVQVYERCFSYRGRPAVMGTLLDVTEKRALEQEILEIQEEERWRIGQELHDGIASQLTGLTMIAESMVRDRHEGQRINAEGLEELTEMLRETAQQTRLLSRGLNPMQMGREDLPTALERLATQTEKQSKLSCKIAVEGNLPDLDEQTATHLYRIAQEAVSNAVKHAKAENISMHLSSSSHSVALLVEDDGKGIDDTSQGEAEGIGLRTMHYRADLIRGNLEITGRPEGGTRVRCRLNI